MSDMHILLQQVFVYPLFSSKLKSFSVTGLEHLADLKGPIIFVANHNSHADTAAILFALPYELKKQLVIAAAKDYFYKNIIVGTIVSTLLNTFAFDRNDVRGALAESTQLLLSGKSMLIYPEGSRDQKKKSFKRGFAILAAECGLPVVPVHLVGTAEMLPKGQLMPTRQHVSVSFGEPVYISKKTTKLSVTCIEKIICPGKTAA